MERSQEISELAKALVLAQAEFRPAPMNATNPFLKNRYADLGAVIGAVRPALAKHGLAFLQPVFLQEGFLFVETILIHASGQFISETLAMPIAGEERGKSAVQIVGGLITYIRRYTLASMLGIYADEDADGNGNPADAPKPAPKPQADNPTHTPTPATTQEPPTAAQLTWWEERQAEAAQLGMDATPVPASRAEFPDKARLLVSSINQARTINAQQ